MSSTRKRKHKMSDSDAESNKIARLQPDYEVESASLQYIANDIAYIIIDFLKLSFESLVALSLTSSRWQDLIQNRLEIDLQRFYPLSYKQYTGHRRCVLEDYYYLQSETLDLQRFEFQTKPTNAIGRVTSAQIYPVPWAPHIVFVKSETGYGIFDLNKKEVISPFHSAFEPETWEKFSLCTMNEQRKQVVITNMEVVRSDSKDCELYDWLNVYNVDDNGTVSFVTKFKSYHTCRNAEAHLVVPTRLLLDGNGYIWHVPCSYNKKDSRRQQPVRKFSIEKNEEIPNGLKMKKRIIGIGEWNGKVLLFCTHNRPGAISVFDTSTNSFLGKLPGSMIKFIEGPVEVIVRNGLAISFDVSRIVAQVFDLNQNFQYLYDFSSDNFLSPDARELDPSLARAFALHEAESINDNLKYTQWEYYKEHKKQSYGIPLPSLTSPFFIEKKTEAFVGDIIYYVVPGWDKILISRLKINRPVRERTFGDDYMTWHS